MKRSELKEIIKFFATVSKDFAEIWPKPIPNLAIVINDLVDCEHDTIEL